MSVTLDPSNVGLGVAPNSFTADSLILTDYAITTLSGTTFSENGFLNIGSFSLGGTNVSPPGLASAGSGAYSLFFHFTASGTQSSPSFNNSSTGSFDTLSFTLYGANGIATFTDGNGVFNESGTSTPVALATGTLLDPADTFTTFINNGQGISTSAQSILTSFVPTAAGSGFVTAPANATLNLSSAFINNPQNVTLLNSGSAFEINGGGGSASFLTAATPVPEPASLVLLGAGLFGVGLIRRRR